MNDQTNQTDQFIPTNPCLRGILKLFLDEKTADVAFEVDGQEFHAHRLILRTCAPDLAEHCDGAKDGATPVPINGVDPEIFRHLLYYVYGGAVPEKVLSERSKEIIDAADRFGVGNLKVEAEGWYARSTRVTLDNFTDILHFSDAKKCALLKEKVMDFMVENEDAALDRLSNNRDVPQFESMLTDILTAMSRKKRKVEGDGGAEFKTMSVNALRQKLDERGLEVDGTREMLVDVLRKCCEADGAVVEGAGTPEINGLYRRDGNHNGLPKYKKSVSYNGENIEFTLSHWWIHHNTRIWYISIVRNNNIRPGNSMDDIDFYSTDVTERSTPPRDGWAIVDDNEPHARAPAPIVYVNSSVDNT